MDGSNFSFRDLCLADVKVQRAEVDFAFLPNHVESDWVKAALAAKAHEFAHHYLPQGHEDGDHWRCGDVDGTPPKDNAKGSGSFVLNLAGEHAGKWQDFATGERGDQVDIIRRRHSVDFHEACRIAIREGYVPAYGRRAEPADAARGKVVEERRKDDTKRRRAMRIWEGAGSVQSTIAEKYLREQRRITAALPGSLRFHPQVRFGLGEDAADYPSLVAGMFDGDAGEIASIIRIPLDSSGAHLKQLGKPMLGSPSGAAVRLGPTSAEVVVVCEGLETGLTILSADPETAVLVAGGAAHFGGLRVAPEATVVIAADMDKPGREAADKLARRLLAENSGRAVLIATASGEQRSDGYDFNDLLREVGVDAVRARIEAAEPVTVGDANRRGPGPETQDEATRAGKSPHATDALAGIKIGNAVDLMNTTFEPPKWVIPGKLPVGLTVIGGKAKIGKSWLFLDVADAVSRGTDALGVQCLESGEVLYLALEDTERRLKKRLAKLLGRSAPSPDFHYVASRGWPRAHEGGVAALREWLRLHPRARLVIIDTWQKFRAPMRAGASIYDHDYNTVAEVKEVADEFGVAVVIVHHLKKAETEDPVDELSGSTGLSGAADTIWIMKRPRGESGAVLHVVGRDIEDDDPVALNFDRQTARWSVVGKAHLRARSPERQRIKDVVMRIGTATRGEIMRALGAGDDEANRIDQLLSQMVKDEELRRAGKGLYEVTDQTE
jgi:hypothetical protein